MTQIIDTIPLEELEKIEEYKKKQYNWLDKILIPKKDRRLEEAREESKNKRLAII